MTVLYIPADVAEDASLTSVDGSWEGVVEALEAFTGEEVELTKGVTLWVNGSGKLLGLPVNPRATGLADAYLPGYAARDTLHGPALVVSIDEGANFGDVPDAVVRKYETFEDGNQD